jgi:SNW domain-containing protein 1
MATLKDLLPAPKTSASTFYDHSSDPWFKERYGGESSQAAAAARPAAAARLMPPYGKRAGFVPRRPEDFGDGGAFPEIHVAQYPLGMGRRDDKGGSRILALTVDAHGSVAFDAVVKQGENAGKIVYSKHSDLVPKIATADSQAMSDDDEEQKQIEETTERTKAALEKVVNVRLSAVQLSPRTCRLMILSPSSSSISRPSNPRPSIQVQRRGSLGCLRWRWILLSHQNSSTSVCPGHLGHHLCQ